MDNNKNGYPKVTNGVALSIYFKKGTIKDGSRWTLGAPRETNLAYEMTLAAAEGTSGHAVHYVNGKYPRLQFLSKEVLPRGWQRWNASPAVVKDKSTQAITVIVPKKTLVPFKGRKARKKVIAAPVTNGSGPIVLKDLFETIDAVNAAKKELGDNLVLSIEAGNLKALIAR